MILLDVGSRFGRWTVIAPAGKAQGGEMRWECQCDCGRIREVTTHRLRSGKSQSCGCLARELSKPRNVTHGHAGHRKKRSRAYTAWTGMISRCHGKPSDYQRAWAGRGIIVCDRWRQDFTAFLSDMGEPPPEIARVSVDRLDNDGNYEPENCVWGDPVTQARNRSATKLNLEKATDICRRARAGESRTSLAAEFGVSRGLVRDIVEGRTWREALISNVGTNPETLIGPEAVRLLRAAGFEIVPREPTLEMYEAALCVPGNDPDHEVWCAMVAAAQRGSAPLDKSK